MKSGGSLATPRDEFELLCERCGYSIEGLPRETNCPECGRPVVESLLEARPGSPWQQRPDLRGWAATVALCLRSPRLAARTLRIETELSGKLRRINIRAAAALLTVLPAATYTTQLLRGEAPYSMRELTWPWAETAIQWLGLAGLLVLWWVALSLTLAALTGTETWGIRSYGRLHAKRITPAVARTITAHATVGWVVAALFVSGGFLLGMLAYEVAMHHDVQPLRGVMMLAPIWMPTILGLVGLLAFESIVYLGVLNCKFANRARPEVTPRHRAASASTLSPERQRDSTNPPGPTPEPGA